MEKRANPYPLRLDPVIQEKAKHIAKANGRSLNKEIEMLLKAAIAEYEKENGAIDIPAPSE